MFRRALQRQFSQLRERAVEGRSSTAAALSAAEDLPVPKSAIREEIERFYAEVGVRVGEMALEHVKRIVPVLVTKQEDEFRRRANEYLDRIGAEKVTQISETTRDDLVRILQSAVNDGIGIDRAANRITETLPQLTQNRATTIARTEIIPASNQAVDAAARAAETSELEKEWVSAQDARVRTRPQDDFDHLAADGQIVDMNEAFTVSGERLRWPGDTSFGASAGNVINCRCAHAPIPKDR